MNSFPSSNLTDVFNHPSQNIAKLVLPWNLHFHILKKIAFQTRTCHNFATLDNKQSQIHFKFKLCQSCLICCKLYKKSCRLSKQWRPWSDAALTLRRLIWVYTVCQSQKYLIWTQTVVTLIRFGVLILVYIVYKCPQNTFGQNVFKFMGCQFWFCLM